MTERQNASGAAGVIVNIIARLIKLSLTIVVVCGVGFVGLVLFKMMTETPEEAFAYGNVQAARSEAIMRLAGEGNVGVHWERGERPKPQTPFEKEMQKLRPWIYIK